MKPVPLYDMFPFLREQERLVSDYTDANILSVTVNSAKTQMDISLCPAVSVPPYEISVIETLISDEYGIDVVNVSITYKSNGKAGSNGNSNSSRATKQESKPALKDKPQPKQPAKRDSRPEAVKPADIIMGRPVKTPPKAISELVIDDGKAVIRGFVCDVRSRYIEKNNSVLMSFDVTDYTGTINVSKFISEGNVRKITNAVKTGMYLTVTGTLYINNRDNELALKPSNIFVSEYEHRTDNAETKRVELHLHTKMSPDGLTDIGEVIARAASWGHSAIAITDHGVVHSYPIAAKSAAKCGGKIKIIYGLEGYLQVEDEKTGKKPVHHIILLAKDRTGLKNIYKLVSKSHIEHLQKKRPMLNKDLIMEHRDGLIIGSACENGELFTAVVAGKEDKELREIAEFYDYLEIQPVCNNMYMLRSEKHTTSSIEDLRGYNKKVVMLGESLGIPVAATTDAHFSDPEHEIFRKMVLSYKGYSGADDELPLYFRTTGEMLDEFSYLGADKAYEVVVTNTNKIAGQCMVLNPLPAEKKYYPPKLDNSADELKALLDKNLPLLYGDSPPDIILKRIDVELKDILRLEYDVIYMAAQKVVAHIKEKGSIVGSRGSVGSSFVAYLSGITEVNPLPAHYRCGNCKQSEFPQEGGYNCGADMPDKACSACGAMYIKDGFNIPFETFLGFDGDKVPDIDLNISGEHQSVAHEFVYDMFGRNHVFRAGTISTIAKQTAYGIVRKYLEQTGRFVTKAEENRLAAGCLGVKQTTGQHPGGVVIVPQDMEITDFCPVQHPSDNEEKGLTTHFDFHSMDDKLIKLDILGHDNPTMLLMLGEMTRINPDDISLDDPDTMSIFSSPHVLGLPEDDEIIGQTGAVGIPEFGTLFSRQMLCDTKPKNFDTLVRLSGYSHGEEVWAGNAKELISQDIARVEETISSRDDIMLYLISMGMNDREAFGVSESVRKGKGLPKGADDKLLQLNIPQWYVESCDKIGYLFPRAHAVAYVMMAFRIAWYKVHRPLEYYSAHFYRRSQKGYFDAATMTCGIDAVKTHIYQLRPRDKKTQAKLKAKEEELLTTFESCYEFYLRGFDFAGIDLYESDAERFLPMTDTDGKQLLRPPFIAINGLGEKAAKALASNRNGSHFTSIEELTASMPGVVNKTHLLKLAEAGAFGDLPETNQMSLF